MESSTDAVPRVSVIVPCRNENDHIEAVVRSILAQERPPGGFEVIVADGKSDDGTRQIIERIAESEPRLRIVDNPDGTVSMGLNAAIRAARGDVVIRMDAHTVYASDYIRQCLAVLQQTGADNVGGPARTAATNYIQSAICAAYHSRFSVGGARFHNPGYEGYVDTVTYGCWRRQIFERLGLFDEELVRNQDDEFNLRIRRAGGTVWQSPRIRSWYRPRSSLRSLFQQYMQYGYWKVRVIQKHRVPASWRHLVPGIFVLMLVILPLVSPWSPLATRAWLGLAGVYTICNVAASLLTAAREGWKLFPVLPVIFACYHFAYGWGFLKGFADFIVLHRQPAQSYKKLTRPSGAELAG